MDDRKRYSAEDAVRTLRCAEEPATEGETSEENAGDLGVPATTLYTWRRACGGKDSAPAT